jgi:hypothetical protein
MSSGSRATQAKPEALSSCSEQPLKPLLFAGDRRSVSACAGFPGFPGNLFLRALPDRTTPAPVRNTVLNLHCAESRNILAIDDKFEHEHEHEHDHEHDHDIDTLIEVGKEKGYLTYGDVNEMLPDEMALRPTIWTT